jgi:4-hydroxy-3-polyprenylbenzoate decarboxylase
VLAVEGPACDSPTFRIADCGLRIDDSHPQSEIRTPQFNAGDVERFCTAFPVDAPLARFRLIVIVDDSQFVAESLRNFLWVTFTRANPAADVHGVGSFVENKHWGCRGPLVIDARLKPHHAPPLVEDPEITRRVDALGAAGGPLEGII